MLAVLRGLLTRPTRRRPAAPPPCARRRGRTHARDRALLYIYNLRVRGGSPSRDPERPRGVVWRASHAVEQRPMAPAYDAVRFGKLCSALGFVDLSEDELQKVWERAVT